MLCFIRSPLPSCISTIWYYFLADFSAIQIRKEHLMLNCQNCQTPCFDFEETGSCPIESNWAPVPCCPDEEEQHTTETSLESNS